MAQADWVTQSGQTLTLNMRGGYRIDADLAKNLARIPGVKDPVPFNFHRSLYQGGKMVRQPSRNIPNARFHLVQTNLPVFLGGRTYEIPKDGMQLEEVAKMHEQVAKMCETSRQNDFKCMNNCLLYTSPSPRDS